MNVSVSIVRTLVAECGIKEIHTSAQFHPAWLETVIALQHNYACPDCKVHGLKTSIQSAPVPQPIFQYSFASPELIVQIADQKFELGLPLYRQQIAFKRLGLDLAPRTMVNWIIKASQILEPLYQALHVAVLKQKILHAVETPSQIIRRSDGRPGTSQARFWVLRSGVDSDCPVVYYQSTLDRSQASADQLLTGFQGTLMTDGYTVYQNLSGVLGAYCWAHVRRKFFEAGNGKGTEGVKIIDALFMIERTIATCTPAQRVLVRQTRSLPIVNRFWRWLESFNSLSQSKLGKAISYARKLRNGLERFLTDGQLMISNNLAERSIRPITVGRKNWLFFTSEAGAHANVVLQTLIRTAIENGLDAEKYLVKLLTSLPRGLAGR